MNEDDLRDFENWGIQYVIETWGWDEDTTPEDFQECDSYDVMKDAWEMGLWNGRNPRR